MKRVVVTGLGVVSPVGNTVEESWENLLKGKCGIDYITKFDTTDFKVKIGAEVKDFEPTLYMEKSEVRRTDLFTQYAVAAATQAMEDSGLEGKVDNERLGVYVGSGIGGINTFVSQTTVLNEKGPGRISPFFIPMEIVNIAAAHVAIKYSAMGPSLPVVTACATATHAIGEAFRAIKHGYADAIITGGAEAGMNPIAIAGFTNCMALCTNNDIENASVPFDKRREGFVLGEGAGVIILEEYEHAKKRGAKIYAEMCGYGNTCDAYHITAPHPEAIACAKALTIAIDEAGMQEEKKIYINAHGTSTPLNDKTETLAIKKALGENAQFAQISSTKSMTGHMLGAAGGIEAMVAIKVLETGKIPPTIGYKEKDEDCDLDYVPNEMRNSDIEIALSTSLGFGGHNGCIAFKKYK